MTVTEQTTTEQTYTTSLGAILTMTTGIMLTEVDDAFALQDFVVGRPLMTHERIDRPKFQGITLSEATNATDTTEALLRQFPALAEAVPPLITGDTRDEKMAACMAWVEQVSAHTGIPVTGVVVRR